jgi:hypothetical protein
MCTAMPGCFISLLVQLPPSPTFWKESFKCDISFLCTSANISVRIKAFSIKNRIMLGWGMAQVVSEFKLYCYKKKKKIRNYVGVDVCVLPGEEHESKRGKYMEPKKERENKEG